jgi:hypothetical protein
MAEAERERQSGRGRSGEGRIVDAKGRCRDGEAGWEKQSG